MGKKLSKKQDKRTRPKRSPKTGLTPKEILFIECYMKNGFDVQKAGKEAGYASKSAGHKLLSKPQIIKHLDKELEIQRWDYKADKTRIIEELTTICFSDVTEFLSDDGSLKPLKKLKPELRRAVSEIEFVYPDLIPKSKPLNLDPRIRKIKVYDKLAALQLLAKLQGHLEPDTINSVTLNQNTIVLDPTLYQRSDLKELDEKDPIEAQIRNVIECTPEKKEISHES